MILLQEMISEELALLRILILLEQLLVDQILKNQLLSAQSQHQTLDSPSPHFLAKVWQASCYIIVNQASMSSYAPRNSFNVSHFSFFLTAKRLLLSVPKVTANIYCICQSVPKIYTQADKVQICGKF